MNNKKMFLSHLQHSINEGKKVRLYRGDSEGTPADTAAKVNRRESQGTAFFQPGPGAATMYAAGDPKIGFGVTVRGDERGEITVGKPGRETRKPSAVKRDVVGVRNLGTVTHKDFAELARKMEEKHGKGFFLKSKHIMKLPSFVSSRAAK